MPRATTSNPGEDPHLRQPTLDSPKGCDIVLLSGPHKGREVYRHFRKAPGTPHNDTKPYVRFKGQNFECTRGRRASHSYKNPGSCLVINKLIEKMKERKRKEIVEDATKIQFLPSRSLSSHTSPWSKIWEV